MHVNDARNFREDVPGSHGTALWGCIVQACQSNTGSETVEGRPDGSCRKSEAFTWK